MSEHETVNALRESLNANNYIADEGLATTLFLSLKMQRPLFLEGAPGVGKTEIAKVLSHLFETELIRLQCYEGLDVSQAVYEWNYPRQLLAMQDKRDACIEDVYSSKYLLKRPLLKAIDPLNDKAPVLLIDEVDRADEEFESFLLEILGDYQVTVPELGKVSARHPPKVILTSNRTREVHDALKRRCLYCWIDYPSIEKETDILMRKVPELDTHVARYLVEVVQRFRSLDLQKAPGIAETLDWARALQHLGVSDLSVEVVEATLGVLVKHRDDLDYVRKNLTPDMVRAGR